MQICLINVYTIDFHFTLFISCFFKNTIKWKWKIKLNFVNSNLIWKNNCNYKNSLLLIIIDIKFHNYKTINNILYIIINSNIRSKSQHNVLNQQTIISVIIHFENLKSSSFIINQKSNSVSQITKAATIIERIILLNMLIIKNKIVYPNFSK